LSVIINRNGDQINPATAEYQGYAVDENENLVPPALASGQGSVDPLGYKVNIPIEHHKVHESEMYTCSDYDADTDQGNSKFWLLRTCPLQMHLMANLSATQPIRALFYENPTITDNGTRINVFNNNRNSDKVSNCRIYRDPTVGDNGTLLETTIIGVGEKKTSVGGVARQFTEWILVPNALYLMGFTALADNTISALGINLYETSHILL